MCPGEDPGTVAVGEQGLPQGSGLGIPEVNRCLAGLVSAIDTAYPPVAAGADALVGRRMPDVGLTALDSEARRVYELLVHGRFVLLDFAGDEAPRATGDAGWGKRVHAVTVTEHDDHPELDGVTEVLVRPDGHVAWAGRDGHAPARRAERAKALADWAGLPTPPAVFMASDEASGMTGTTIDLTMGGLDDQVPRIAAHEAH